MGQDGNQQNRSAPGTGFLDLELSKMLAGQAEKAAHEALHTLLLDAAKKHLEAAWGERIDGLAALAVQKLVGEMEANLRIEAEIQRQGEAKRDAEAALRDVFANGAGGDG